MRILGIDPGSRLTGYGIIEDSPQGYKYIASGSIRIKADYFPDRLKQIFDGILEIVDNYQPEQMAIEQVFMHKNADSALKLGQARGAAICAVQTKGCRCLSMRRGKSSKRLLERALPINFRFNTWLNCC